MYTLAPPKRYANGHVVQDKWVTTINDVVPRLYGVQFFVRPSSKGVSPRDAHQLSPAGLPRHSTGLGMSGASTAHTASTPSLALAGPSRPASNAAMLGAELPADDDHDEFADMWD